MKGGFKLLHVLFNIGFLINVNSFCRSLHLSLDIFIIERVVHPILSKHYQRAGPYQKTADFIKHIRHVDKSRSGNINDRKHQLK